MSIHILYMFSNWIGFFFTPVKFEVFFVYSRCWSSVRVVVYKSCISSQSVAYIFILLTGSFENKNFTFGKVKFVNFPLMDSTLGVQSVIFLVRPRS